MSFRSTHFCEIMNSWDLFLDCLSNYIPFNTNLYIQCTTLYTVEAARVGIGAFLLLWQTIPGSHLHVVLFSCLFFFPVLSVFVLIYLYKSCPMYVTLCSLLACFIVFYCLLLCLLGTLCSRALCYVCYVFT